MTDQSYIEAKAFTPTTFGRVQRDVFNSCLAAGQWSVVFRDWDFGVARRFYGRDPFVSFGRIDDRPVEKGA